MQASFMERSGLTSEIAKFVAGTTHGAIPPEAARVAKRAFIDTVGVILAGRGEPVVTKMQGLLPEGDEAFARWKCPINGKEVTNTEYFLFR